ncbi:MAG: PAS domain S-box protein [Chlorobiaceae bacterium]|nr:PAS domain S-box protein [Chlorobiaceae bacterium]
MSSDFGLFRDFPEPVFIMDTQGTILDANEIFALRFFRSAIEIRGTNVYDLLSTVQKQPAVSAYRKAKAEEVLRTGRHLFFDDEKDKKHWRHFIHPVRNTEGVITRLLVIVHDITIAKQEEYQSRKDNIVFKALLDAIPGSVAILDAQGRLSGFNQHAIEVFGKSESELYGCDPFEILHPEDRDSIVRKFLNTLIFGSEESAEARVFKGGNPDDIRWFILHARKTEIDGQPFVVTVNIDIDKRKQMENSLIESKRWLKLAMQSAQAGIWDRNLRTGENIWSDEFWTLSGFDKTSAPASSFDLWTSLIHPDDRERVLRMANIDEIENSQNLSIEYRICRPDGSIRWMLSQGGPVHDSHGKVERLVGTTMDITERKMMEEELKKTHTRLDFTLEKCHLGWWEFNPQNNTTNRTLEHDRIFGYETLLPEWHYHLFLDHLVADDRERVRQHCSLAKEKNEDFSFECRIRRNDGLVRWIWVAGGFWYDLQNKSHLMSGIVQDITERKRQEEEQERLQVKLQQAQKMEVVGQLAGGIAHDFNNALMAILGNADLLSGKVHASFPFLEHINDIRKSALRSANMTRHLLAFASKQIITPRVCSIDEEIENLLPMIKGLIGNHIRFSWQPESGRACVLVDPSQLDQILINLCINARDAISSNGFITLQTNTITVEADDCSAGHPCQTAGNYVRISVCDNGSGIDAVTLPHIFEPFFTTKEVGKGTGLGLSTVYGILKQNKGYLDCITNPGFGTSFIVYLPACHEVSCEKKPEPVEELTRTKTKETILLVEDEPNILSILQGLLENQGFSILSALNSFTAMELAARHQGKIDLLITDIVLPEINGIVLSEQLLALRPDLKTLFMSGYAQETFGQANHLHKEVNFIQKPFSIRIFLDMVSRILHHDNGR